MDDTSSMFNGAFNDGALAYASKCGFKDSFSSPACVSAIIY